MKVVHTILAALLCGLPAILGACSNDPKAGYTLQRPHEKGIRSVAVPIWTRGADVYRRELEFRVTEALQKRIEQDTDYKVLPRDRADTELTGTIDRISQRPLSFDPDIARPREMEITMILSFTWTDLRTGKVLRRRSNFRVAGTYLPPSPPFGEDFFLGSEDVVNNVARRIVEQMEQDW
ncbi:MAG TPA: LptE family protein [Phycisphaerae bacterium]|nr:LptE family protein [Phycisphaerae bacterium]